MGEDAFTWRWYVVVASHCSSASAASWLSAACLVCNSVKQRRSPMRPQSRLRELEQLALEPILPDRFLRFPPVPHHRRRACPPCPVALVQRQQDNQRLPPAHRPPHRLRPAQQVPRNRPQPPLPHRMPPATQSHSTTTCSLQLRQLRLWLMAPRLRAPVLNPPAEGSFSKDGSQAR